jgi:OmpA family/Abnormal spindle-like microcephaly-assoc'd, ASPM-SPD-2-Hydin/Thrombospondin type 3 repeat
MSKRWLGLLLCVVWIGSGGVAHAVAVTETPDPIAIGPVAVGSSGTGDGSLTAASPVDVTLQLGTGPDCSQFQIMSATSLTVDTTASTVTVKLTPTSAGTKTCTITVMGATPPKSFGVTGTGVGTPQISVAPPALAFSSVDVGRTSATQPVTATNTGTGTLTITSATFSAGATNYTVSGTTGSQTVAPGASVSWDIACKPPAPGTADGTFRIVSDSATGSPSTVALTCSGNQGTLTTDVSSLDFAAVLLNASRTRTLVLRNTGNVAVTGITGVLDKTTIGYSIDPTTPVPATLNAGTTAMLTVKFAPVAVTDGGPAKITFTGSWGTSNTTTAVVTLAGQTVSLNVTPTALDFGTFRFDSAPQLVYHIINNGSSDIPIQSADFTPDAGTTASELTFLFKKGATTVTLPQTLTGGQQLDVTVTARPNNRTGLVSGHVDVHSTTPGIPDQRVTVTGNATAAILTTSALIDFSAVDIDATPSPLQTAMILNTGTAVLDISSITKMAGASTAFTITLPAGATSVNPGTTLAIPITYTPTVERGPGDFDSVVLIANLVGVLNGPTMAMITIRGRGIDRNLNIQAMPTFPPTFRNPGDMAPVRALTVHNNGEALLRISALMIAGDPVWKLVDSAPVDIAGGASHDFLITFSPTTIGPAPTGQVTLVNNDNNRPMVTVTLTGTGVKRNVELGPEAPALPAIDLGYTGVGIPITEDEILAVTSKDPDVAFMIHMIQLSGDGVFRVEDAPANVVLPAAGVKRFAITFAPTAVGDFQTKATLYLDQDPQPQAEVTITGHAVFVDAHGGGGCDAGGSGRGGGLVIGLAALGALGRRRRRAGLAIAATAVIATVATVAIAPAARADSIGIAVFEPTPATTGTGFQLQSPEVGADGSWVASSTFSYASKPLVLDARTPDGMLVNRDALIERSSVLQLGGAYAFSDRFEVGAHIPLYTQSGEPRGNPTMGFTADPANGTARGNLTLHGKARLWRGHGGPGSFIAGASALVVVPTATKDQFTGSDKLAVRGLLLASFTPAALASRLAISANGGAVLRGKSVYANIVQQSGVVWGAGASYRVLDNLWATAEMFGEATPSGKRHQAAAGAPPPAVTLSPVEWLAGVSYKVDPRFIVSVAGGRGVTDGLGTPDVRGVLSLALVSGASAPAALHPVEVAKPDGDADGDGIPDSIDKCPSEPEDKDLFEDQDGCPDPDNDHDGVADADDKCPLDPEDKDGFQDADGCPDKDNDGDGIADAQDKCPNEPEDKDGFQDLDGCPEPDNDLDGIPDAQDRCPNEPETINGIQDSDGCPDKGDTSIILSPDRIETLDPIQFTGLKLARSASPLLEQVAATLRAHSEIVRLRITVHVQPTDSAEADKTKSDKRAQAVREWLLQWGIAPARVEARGFGGTKPLVPADQRGAAKINDRLELIILERK